MSPVALTPTRRRWRLAWRGCRIAALLVLLLGLVAVLYLHLIGVPGWVGTRIADALRQRGVELSCERLRLRLDQGWVAEAVTLGLSRRAEAPEVRFERVILEPDWAALLRRRVWEPHTLVLRQGRASIPLTKTPAPAETLRVEDITAQLNLTIPGVWKLEAFTARALAARWQIRGSLTNGPALWRQPRSPGPDAEGRHFPWQEALRRIQRTLAELRFANPPEIRLNFSGDGLRPDSWTADLHARAAAVDTPWGRGRELQLAARWGPRASGAPPELDAGAELESFVGPRGRARQVRVQLAGAPRGPEQPEAVWKWSVQAAEVAQGDLRFHQPRVAAQTLFRSAPGPLHTTAHLTAGTVQTPWADAARLEGDIALEHSLAWCPPERLSARLHCQEVNRGEVGARELALDLSLEPGPEVPAEAAAALPAPVRWLAPLAFQLGGRAEALRGPGLAMDQLHLGARWRFPELAVTNLQARLLGGHLQLTGGRLELVRREASADFALDFDLQRLDRLLPGSVREWLAQFQYPAPPQIAGAVSVCLPPGDHPGPEAGRQMLSTLALRARVEGHHARYRELTCSTAGVTVTVSNEVLRLRELEVVRPEGRASLAYDLNLRTRDFRWRVDCALDPRAAAPVVDEGLPPIVGQFEFSTPPRVTGEVWGNWNPPKPVDFALQIAATHFALRGEAFDTLSLHLGKTNGVLTFSDLHLRRGSEWLQAPWSRYDLSNRVVTLTNAGCRMDPLVVARCLGSNVAAVLAPYHFAQPPEVQVNGSLPVDAPRGAALDFEVAGGPFRFWRFQTTNLTTGVRWRGDRVSVTNLAATFYGGRLSGGLTLDLNPEAPGDAAFGFQALATEFDLQSLLQDVLPGRTNRLEGVTTVALIVTDARTSDWQSWHGRGQVEMRNGLLWDLPIFGLLSQALNLVVPGLGNSRATAARATFRLQRSVIYTDDLAIEAGPARLQYRGTVDFEGRVDARVVAEVLHRTPIIGPLISLALTPVAKVFEYKITGTLWEPELRPLHVPGFLRPLLNPLGTLQNLITPSTPPAPPPEPKP